MTTQVNSSAISVEQKLKAKKAAYNIKFGSPKLRDLMREKCKIRIKESRLSTFNRKRNFDQDDSLVVTDVIAAELQDLKDDIELYDTIYNEIMEEALQWTFEELDQELFALNENNNKLVFFCPICQKFELEPSDGFVYCAKCNIKLRTNQISPQQFYDFIQIKIKQHDDTGCSMSFNYFTEPVAGEMDLLALNCFCPTCEYFCLLN